MHKDHGASADADRAATPSEPNPAVSGKAGIPCALAGADDWEVAPCVNRLGNVTSWDINIKPGFGDRGVAVIASVYSGEVTARAILAAIHSAAIEARRAALTRLVQMDEELGLYDDEPLASGMEAPSGGETGTGSTEGDSPTAESGDAQ